MEAILNTLPSEGTSPSTYFSAIDMAFNYTHLFIDFDLSATEEILTAAIV